MTELIRQETALAWELRLHALRGREVILLLRGSAEQRLRGYVVGISPTGAFTEIDDARWEEPRQVPLSTIESVRRPHFHEDGEDALRALSGRPPRERRKDPDPFPGQLRLGGSVPEVSRRSAAAAERASGLLLPQDLLDVLGALDSAVKRRKAVPTARVAEVMGRSPQWTVRRLGRLAEMRLALPMKEGRRYAWSPGE
jgi:hypothetical protein